MKKISPLILFALLLNAYALLTLLLRFSEGALFHAFCIYGAGAIGFIIWRSGTKKRVSPWNLSISLAIIFLILQPWGDSMSYVIALAAVGLLFALKICTVKGRPIINPAVGALLILSALAIGVPAFNQVTVSWWGAAYFGSWSLLFLLPALYVSARYFRKMPLMISCIITFCVLSFLVSGMGALLFALTTGTLYFFAGIMLIEPKTSPIIFSEQVIFGVSAALLVFGLGKMTLFASPEIISIALVNVLYFIYRVKSKN